MYVVTVTFAVEPAHVEPFRAAMREQARASLAAEPGCRQFDVAFDPDDPCACFLYEVYADRAAFEQHLRSAHFAAFDATVGPWLASKQVRCYQRDEG